MKQTAIGLICAGLLSLARAATTDVFWDYSDTGDTITNAADWFDVGNWTGGTVADSAAY